MSSTRKYLFLTATVMHPTKLMPGTCEWNAGMFVPYRHYDRPMRAANGRGLSNFMKAKCYTMFQEHGDSKRSLHIVLCRVKPLTKELQATLLPVGWIHKEAVSMWLPGGWIWLQGRIYHPRTFPWCTHSSRLVQWRTASLAWDLSLLLFQAVCLPAGWIESRYEECLTSSVTSQGMGLGKVTTLSCHTVEYTHPTHTWSGGCCPYHCHYKLFFAKLVSFSCPHRDNRNYKNTHFQAG